MFKGMKRERGAAGKVSVCISAAACICLLLFPAPLFLSSVPVTAGAE